MSKYRIVKHQAGDVIRYCPEVWECRAFIGKCQESWWKLAGNENLTSLDLWVGSLPETIEEAKSIIKKHIEDQKPKYSEEVVYEYDTKNPRGMISKQPLEEAAEKQCEVEGWGIYEGLSEQSAIKNSFIAGAKWMQEQFKNESTADYIDRHIVQAMVETVKQKMYSEEEVLQLLLKLQQTEFYDNLYDWFEQNKKK